MQRSIDFLLSNACPSIQYRIRAEILGESRTNTEMLHLVDSIIIDKRIQYVFSWQQADGFLGEVFHSGLHDRIPQQPSTRGMEGAIRFLVEMGISREHPVLARALDALRRDDWFRDHMGVCWTHYPKLGMYGLDFVRAVTLAVAGLEDHLLVKPYEQVAIETLRTVLSMCSMDEITEDFKGRRVFKPGIRFPESNHLKLLGNTMEWKTLDNLAIVKCAVTRLVDLSPLPVVKVRYGSRWLGPAAIYPSHLNPTLKTLSPGAWPEWFHTFELFARMGIVPSIPALQRQLDELIDILAQGDGVFTLPVDSHRARGWGSYTGLALEPDWTGPRMAYDLTFRCLLILHYSGILH